MDKRVVVFGDSIAKGRIYEDNKLQKLDNNAVSLIAKEYGYEITNLAKYGLSLKKLNEKNIIENYLKETNPLPEYAVICIGGNDADYNWKEVALSPLESHKPITPVEEFSALLNKTVALLKEVGIKVILTTIPPVSSERYFKNVICKISDGQKVLEFFDGDVTNISRHQEAYNYAIIGTAVTNDCHIIDLRTGFLLDKNYLANYCIDGIHPNACGHKFMAMEIVKSLARQGLYLTKRN